MSDSSLIVRAASPDDASAIAPLVGEYWEFEGIDGYECGRIEALLSRAISAPDYARCWLAQRDGAVIGYLLVVFVFSLEHQGMMAEVDEFHVRANARGTGIGDALLAYAEAALREQGIVRMQLQLGVANARARRFYERHHYVRRNGYELWDKALGEPAARA